MSLNDLREQIDKIDSELVELLNKRAEVSLEVGRRKAGTPDTRWFAPEREREVFKNLEAKLDQTSAALPKPALHAIYREILSSSRELQKPLTVAYFGPAGTFTHIAAILQFGSSTNMMAVNSFAEVFSTVEHERADFGIIPVENSIEGVVTYTLDALQLTNLKICSERYVPIVQNLLSKADSLAKVERLYTGGPQPLAQCRQWIATNLEGAELIDVMPTARATQRAAEDPAGAAIAPALCSEIYGVPILIEHIEDDPRNTTRFVVVGRNEPPPTGRDKTSILFAVKNEPGGLARALRAFEEAGVNLTLITSRPSKHTPWDYVQFVDMQGHEKDEPVKKALAELKTHSLFVTILGSYPEA